MPSATRPEIRTVLLCDLVASTGLIERIGDAAAGELLARHDRAARDLLARFGGREIDKSDGFLLLFARPIEAVRFAIAYQGALREIGAQIEVPVIARVGIHLGEVVLRENAPEDVARGAKPLEVEGLAKAIAARVMSLAANGRILLTRTAYDVARRATVGADEDEPLRWAMHGAYRLAGVDAPVEVCEVAGAGDAALTRPASVEKARHVDDEGEAFADGPLLAVLAFDNQSSDPEMDFFSDGVSEEIIRRVARGAKLGVIGRTSSFQFRGERKAEAAQRLNCTHVLDGSVRRAGQRVRVGAHLVEAASQTTLWSERYDRNLEDIFAVQDEISERIADALDQTFTATGSTTVDPAVYDLYLRASPASYAPDELRARIALLEEATRRAPDFAEAWGRLAYLRSWLHFYEPFAVRPGRAARVREEAERALDHDPQNVDALTGMLFVIPAFGHFAEGDAIAERIRRAPGAAGGHRYLGWYLRTMGRVQEALVDSERAYRLDALHPMTVNLVALARMTAGRWDEAVPIFEDLVTRQPDMSFPLSSLLRAHVFREDWDAVDRLLALAERRQLREFRAGLPFFYARRDPTPERLDAWRRDLEKRVDATGGVDLAHLVYTAHLGLVDEAYAAADVARLGPAGNDEDVMGPDGYRTSFVFQAGMPELRNDPRFPRLCARLGLVDFWMESGKWPDCVDEVPYDFRAGSAAVRNVPKEPFGV